MYARCGLTAALNVGARTAPTTTQVSGNLHRMSNSLPSAADEGTLAQRDLMGPSHVGEMMSMVKLRRRKAHSNKSA